MQGGRCEIEKKIKSVSTVGIMFELRWLRLFRWPVKTMRKLKYITIDVSKLKGVVGDSKCGMGIYVLKDDFLVWKISNKVYIKWKLNLNICSMNRAYKCCLIYANL